MEIFKDMASQHPRGSTRDGHYIRVSSPEDGVGVGTNSMAALGEAKPISLAKNVNFSLFLRPAVMRAAGGRCGFKEFGRGSGFVRKVVDMTKETGRSHETYGPEEKVDPKLSDQEVKNVLRDAEPSANPSPEERLLGSSSMFPDREVKNVSRDAETSANPSPEEGLLGSSSMFPDREVKNVLRDVETSMNPGPQERLLGSSLMLPNQEVKDALRDVETSTNPSPEERLLGSSSMLALRMEKKRVRSQVQTSGLRVPASSACSQGASNDPGVTLKRRYVDCRSSSQNDNGSEDLGRTERSSSAKDSGSSVHNSSSERRRGRVSKKLRALQELLPNSGEVDQVAVLDEAIEYLKTLQQQFLVLSTGSPMYMAPLMMLPAGIQQMYSPYLNQFPAANVPRGMNIGAGVRCGGLQFPISYDPRTTASIGSGILGLQSMAHIRPLIPFFGHSSAPPLSTQVPSTDKGDLLDSAALSGSSELH